MSELKMTRGQIEELRDNDDKWDGMGYEERDELCALALRGLASPTAEEVREACGRVCDDVARRERPDETDVRILRARARGAYECKQAIRTLDLTTLKERADEK